MPDHYLIVTGDFVVTGGMDRANYALADFLARQGAKVELVAYRVAEELSTRPNVIFHRVAKPANSYLLGTYWLQHEGRRRAAEVAARGGRVIVNGGNCTFGDVNWVHYVHAVYRPETRTALRRLKQVFERARVLRAERRALAMAKCVIANSHATRDAIIERLGLPDDRVKTVYYGVDPEKFRPPQEGERQSLRAKWGWDETPRVVFVGGLGDRRKGFDVVAEAWINLSRESDWKGKLVVIGSGADQAFWRDRMRQAGCQDSIEFLGFRSDVPELLRGADCLVSPTRYEAYGLGVHEALCCGLPAFVSRKAGVAERYPNELQELLLDDPNDARMLAVKLKRWQSQREEWASRLGKLSESLRNRTWDRMAAEIVEKVSDCNG